MTRFEHVKITFKDGTEQELDKGIYDFYVRDGVIALLCFAAKDSDNVVNAKLIQPSEIKLIDVY